MQTSIQSIVMLFSGTLMVLGGAAGMLAMIVLALTMPGRTQEAYASLAEVRVATTPLLREAMSLERPRHETLACDFPSGPGTVTIERDPSGTFAGRFENGRGDRSFTGRGQRLWFTDPAGNQLSGRFAWQADRLDVHIPADGARSVRCLVAR
ncbi:MAG: hypothetical protein AAGA48_25425 [Myxococcota bacterium]